jgi:hypothetical protein
MLAWGKSVTPGRERARGVGRDLARLKRTRRDADYQLDRDFEKSVAEDALAFAKQLCRQAGDAKARFYSNAI